MDSFLISENTTPSNGRKFVVSYQNDNDDSSDESLNDMEFLDEQHRQLYAQLSQQEVCCIFV